jgi:hypothetical protein
LGQRHLEHIGTFAAKLNRNRQAQVAAFVQIGIVFKWKRPVAIVDGRAFGKARRQLVG